MCVWQSLPYARVLRPAIQASVGMWRYFRYVISMGDLSHLAERLILFHRTRTVYAKKNRPSLDNGIKYR